MTDSRILPFFTSYRACIEPLSCHIAPLSPHYRPIIARLSGISYRYRFLLFKKIAFEPPLLAGDCLPASADEKDARCIHTFLRSVRQYVRMNAASYAVDPDDLPLHAHKLHFGRRYARPHRSSQAFETE
jgi:hypothetical protein